MTKSGLSAEEAFEILGIPEEEQSDYLSALNDSDKPASPESVQS